MKPLLIAALLFVPMTVMAQDAPPQVLPASIQIKAAVEPLPPVFRDSATVLGYASADSGLVKLRAGEGPFVCLADNPNDNQFHTACYHESLEPFMARGRELRAQGIELLPEIDAIRNREIEEGKLPMPAQGAALYSLTGDRSTFNPETGDVDGARPLYVIYVPFATGDSMGLPVSPLGNLPWLMSEGTAKAHIMFRPDMP